MALVKQSCDSGNNFFIRSDIKGFFTEIPRPIVSSYLQNIIDDRRFTELFERAIATNLANLEQLGDDALLFPLGERGVAQGNPLSPLIGNILLRDFDRDLNTKGIICIRYIDDFLLMGSSRRKVDKAFHHAQQLLNGFGLSAYEPGTTDKADSGIVQDGFDFLDCSINPGLIQPTKAARRKIISQIDTILDDGRRAIASARSVKSVDVSKQRFVQTLDRIDRVVRGWGHAYAFCNGRQCFDSIDRAIDAKLCGFRAHIDIVLRQSTAQTARRILGVHLLADTPRVPLPAYAVATSFTAQEWPGQARPLRR
jgi:RNA-directed DNA polymerase